jgi:hypothetical protein
MKTIAVAVLSLVLSSAAAVQEVTPSLPMMPTPVTVRLAAGHWTKYVSRGRLDIDSGSPNFSSDN